jgi:putative FmdB family regulatory protein
MPVYDYVCAQCKECCEQLRAVEERDAEMPVCGCGGVLRRVLLVAPKLGQERYQMKAVLGDGSHVAGHFGKQAPLYKGAKR